MLYLYLFPIPRNTINNIVPSTVPTTRETIYINGFDIAPTRSTNIPPWGAFEVQPNNILKVPATPLEINKAGITLNELLAANGMAPSVITSLPAAPAEVTKAVPVTHRKSRGRYENFQKS